MSHKTSNSSFKNNTKESTEDEDIDVDGGSIDDDQICTKKSKCDEDTIEILPTYSTNRMESLS